MFFHSLLTVHKPNVRTQSGSSIGSSSPESTGSAVPAPKHASNAHLMERLLLKEREIDVRILFESVVFPPILFVLLCFPAHLLV